MAVALFALAPPAHAAPPHAHAAKPDAPPQAAAEPQLVRGALPNGLRFAILPNHTPKQEVSLRMYVRAGSGLETEAQRGVAHFVEHMAFEGSRRFPGDSADARFAAAGVSIGRDQNAFTDVSGVDYVLDLQQADDAKLDLAFAWLRDVADGLTFDAAAAEREKKVVLSEVAARRTGASDLAELIARFMAPGLLATRRTPGGTIETVTAQTGATLKAFHDTWYRPDRTLVVIVGDLTPADARQRLETAFGDWRAEPPAPIAADPGRVDPARPLSVLAIHTPNFAQGLLQVCHVAARPPPEAPGAASWEREGADAIWLQALNTRLRKLARAPDAPFLTPSAAHTEAYRAAAFTCVSAAPKADRWRETLTVLDDEARRMAAHGVTAGELKRILADLDTAVASAQGGAETRRSEALAQGLLQSELDDRVLASPAELARTYALARPHLTAEAARDAFRKAWAGGGPVLALTSTTPADTDQLKAAWALAEARPEPAPPIEEATVAWPYADFGPSGKVVERREIHDPDFTRLRFANGVRVNFKRTAFLKDRVDIRVAFGAGQQEVAPDALIAGLVGLATLGDGGLGKLDSEALGRALQGHVWNANLGMERARFLLSGATRPSDLLIEFQALAAFLTDPGFRPEVELRVPSLASAYYKGLTVEPVTAATQAVNAVLPKPHVFDPPPPARFAALKAADMAGALKPALTGAPLEVTIVGDISEAEATDALSRTLGALPARPDAPRARPDAARQRYPDPPPPVIRTRHSGLESKAAVYVAWPLYVWDPLRQRETRQLTLLREVLGEALRRELREAMGLTYTPSVALNLDRGGDQGVLAVAIETAPDQVDAVASAVRDIAGRLAAPGGVKPEELERVRKPLLDDTARRQETNGWWLTTLDGSWADPYKLAQQRSWLTDYSTIPASEVQAAATRWLSRPPIVAIAEPTPRPKPPAAAAPVAQPAPLAPTPPAPQPTAAPGP